MRRTDQGNFRPWEGKLSVKADESQVGQGHENVERKREY